LVNYPFSWFGWFLIELSVVEMLQADAKAKILIVDDQPENLIALDAVLAAIGQEVIKANSGREALKLLLEEEVALILLDIQMPDMDGFETAGLIRQRQILKHTPIIFLTAMYTEDIHESEAYALGAVDFITKPFSPHVLLSKVNFFVDLYKKQKHIEMQAKLIREMEERRLLEMKDRLESEKHIVTTELARKAKEAELLEERSTQLQKADRLKDEFLANMSHEIRTPMNAVIGFSELLLGTNLDTEQFEFTEKIKESAQGLLTLINDILDLSKIAAGKLDLEPVDFELAPLVEGTVAILSESAREKNLSLLTFVDPDLPRVVVGDPGRLRQVLLNLIGNAIKFTEHGEVVVRATKVVPQTEGTTGGTEENQSSDDAFVVSFSISDTGIGLSEEETGRLFRPFTQADGSTTRRFGGTGLGLSISKRLVELMGGDIGVNSSPGKGATFWFAINMKPALENSLEERKFPEELTASRVLIVDSHPSARSILKAYIASWQIKCDAVESSEEALGMLKERGEEGEPYDLVVTDLSLTDATGFEFLDMIQMIPELSETKVILCTAQDRQGLGEKALASGFSAYLTKPLEQSCLYNCLAKIMCGSAQFQPSDLKTISGSFIKFAPAGTTILLAEDNPVNQMVTQLQLKKLGYHCSVVGTGRAAVDALQAGSFALVLMDCQMPDMDGLEATRAIRKAETLTGRHIPVIGLTAHAMGGDREKCIASGMDDYLSKPASLEQLSHCLKKWISRTEGEATSQFSGLQDGAVKASALDDSSEIDVGCASEDNASEDKASEDENESKSDATTCNV